MEALREAVDATDDNEAKAEALRDLVVHPCAVHEMDMAEVWDELHSVLRQLEEYDEAIEAKEVAIDAGYRSFPHPRTDIAEILLLAGRVDDAEATFREIEAADPDDVWLANAASLAYEEIDDLESAERWARRGIETAERAGDPDGIAPQLLETVERVRAALDLDDDPDLADRVAALPRAKHRPFHVPEPEPLQPCTYCDFDPAGPPARLEPQPAKQLGLLTIAWFPADEWEKANARWPSFREEEYADHGEYSRSKEARLKFLARETPGMRLGVAPIEVAAIEAYAQEKDLDVSESSTRAAFAAELARTGQEIPWPPARNQPCWCGSARKYKRCCGPVPAFRDPE